MQKTAEITEDHMLWLPVQLAFGLSPLTLSHQRKSLAPPLSPSPPSADLCGEERGGRWFPPAYQREEERLGPYEVPARNMMAMHFSLTLSLIEKLTTREKYSGVFS